MSMSQDRNLVAVNKIQKTHRGLKAILYRRITVPLDGREPSIGTLVPKEEYTSMELPRLNPEYKVSPFSSSATNWQSAASLSGD